ncbi:hypothetical protein N7539_001348 [Penicillium diatomitis]|uniref:Uncharacterized protein n=1 Tax=Penicillium diatomitis TaxID=2819901 RepID=A0A9W9XGK0_9EURO|nr:uncharacterized protein N7539_001348 [Penicillium diatomitis]KAJ5492602.1 hypothetical protein N7539_001348 [Penicillium diatomitis]
MQQFVDPSGPRSQGDLPVAESNADSLYAAVVGHYHYATHPSLDIFGVFEINSCLQVFKRSSHLSLSGRVVKSDNSYPQWTVQQTPDSDLPLSSTRQDQQQSPTVATAS